MLRVVLYQPEIPQNTGNIARSCVATGSELHLVRPLGFMWDEARLRRAGLDYWPHLSLHWHDSWRNFCQKLQPQDRVWAFTTHGQQNYTQVQYQPGDFLLFGPESRGLPLEVRQIFPQLVIPMPGPVRSLNLAVAGGVALFEGLRQQGE